MNPRVRYFLIFSISFLALSFEFLHTRIFSFVYWYHLTYFIITAALLGMGIAGIVFTLSRVLRDMEERWYYALCFFGFAVGAWASVLSLTFFRGDFFYLPSGIVDIGGTIFITVLAMAPYAFFGLALARAWRDAAGNAGKIYFFNLVGSALGTFAFAALLGPLSAGQLLFLLAFAAIIIAASLRHPFRKFPLNPLVPLYAAFSLVVLVGLLHIEILPDAHKQYWQLFKRERLRFTEWNPIARVDVIEDAETGKMAILNDGDAQTPLVRVNLDTMRPENLLDEFIQRDLAYIVRGVGYAAPRGARDRFRRRRGRTRGV